MIRIISNVALFSIFLQSGWESVLISRPMSVFLSMLFGLYTAKRVLKNNSNLIFFLFVLLDFIISKLLVINYYNSSYQFSNDYHNLLILTIIVLSFSFISKDTIKEFNKSITFSYSYGQLNNLFTTYKFFNFFNYTVLSKLESHGRKIDQNGNYDPSKLFFFFLVDFIILNCAFFSRTVYKIITSKSKKRDFIKAVRNLLMLFFFTCLIFYLNFSENYSNIIRETIKLFPDYIRNTLYNVLPNSSEKRFKIAIFGLFSFFM